METVVVDNEDDWFWVFGAVHQAVVNGEMYTRLKAQVAFGNEETIHPSFLNDVFSGSSGFRRSIWVGEGERTKVPDRVP